MKHAKKKKRRSSQAPKKVDPGNEEKKVVQALTEAFSSVFLDDAVSAYREAKGDPDKAAEILGRSLYESSEDPSTSSTSGECSGSGSSDGSVEMSYVDNLVKEKDSRACKQKRVIAATGTVSTVLGKEYMNPSPRKDSRTMSTKLKGFGNGVFDEEKAEQFLCSMLGEESELNLAIVRDVLCQCGYDVEKALDALLDLSSSYDQSTNGPSYSLSYKDDSRYPNENCDTLTDRISDCSSLSSECELHDSIWSVGCGCRRNYKDVLASSEGHCPTNTRSTELDLSQSVLDSLFNISKSPTYQPKTMNWRNVAKKLQLLGPQFDVCPSSDSTSQQDIPKGDEYHAFRKTANQQWNSVRSCYEKAATAYSKGAREYAAYLSEQGQEQTKLAQKADERASKDIFKARNKSIQNVITIDLHGQHVGPAMRLLKMHLIFVSYAQTVQILRVITGCGTHGMGRSKLKQSVIKLLEKEGVEWSEENRGTVLIKLDGHREFGFLDSESDTE
ncbi:SMR domain-containing protein At5g58720 isoform X2 [Humulus lupulus]|uniref:SMR domain-containing protein At5g58720 isoform X2 n=1 Tax=Humulus lupulus TaxID=3486 RepID=UPI002B4080A9|nr:SMR domain-containing protein At5g58720 isoform X2 [Humulus lupulus]